MALGVNTFIVNGRQVALPPSSVYSPTTYLPQPGRVPQSGPAVPSSITATSAAVANQSNASAAVKAASNPWSFKDSPLPWTILGLVVGLALLKWINWSSIEKEVTK